MSRVVSARTPPERAGGSPLRLVYRELRITVLLLADNAVANVPPILLTVGACAHRGSSVGELAASVLVSMVLFFCYAYVFDSLNQAVGGAEDRVNKPWRPVPAGLVTTRGLVRRFWAVMAAYTLLGWVTGTLVWVLAWQVIAISTHLVFQPRHYLWFKPVAMAVGMTVQMAAAWQLVTPIDGTGWTWIVTIMIMLCLPMRYEDVRDVEGDRRLGRVTLPMLVGHWPVRIWLAVCMAVQPVCFYLLLYVPSPADPWVAVACGAVMAVLCWTVAVRALVVRDRRADRITYQLYCLTYSVATASAAVLLWG